MKKTNDPNQLTMFSLTSEAEDFMVRERVLTWYYLASPRRSLMISEHDGEKVQIPHNLSHVCPWLTNKKRIAKELAVKISGTWEVVRYPYKPF